MYFLDLTHFLTIIFNKKQKYNNMSEKDQPEINIIYNININEKYIRIFGSKFVENIEFNRRLPGKA